MLQMTIQGRYKFLGKAREPGEVIPSQELFEAIRDGRTTMTAVNALKNRQLAILQDEAEANAPAQAEEIARLHRNMARIADHLGVELEAASEAAPSAETKESARDRRKARKTAAA